MSLTSFLSIFFHHPKASNLRSKSNILCTVEVTVTGQLFGDIVLGRAPKLLPLPNPFAEKSYA
jgi:hypothetical protein